MKILFGDTSGTLHRGVGLSQQLVGDVDAVNFLYGDADALAGTGRGGDDTLYGGDAADYFSSPPPRNYLFGDASAMSDTSRGGNDIIFTGDVLDPIGRTHVNADACGDADSMTDRAVGGDDKLYAGDTYSENFGEILPYEDVSLHGDAHLMSARAAGGDDRLVGGNEMNGDAQRMSGRTTGGNDTLKGAPAGIESEMVGDAGLMSDRATGGDDRIAAGESNFTSYGDAVEMFGGCVGGNDTLFGGTVASTGMPAALYGDAYRAEGSVRFGNDRLIGGVAGTACDMYGDAAELVVPFGGVVRDGNDVLVSGAGDERMWGDSPGHRGGQDVFIFRAGHIGDDTVWDFTTGVDRIGVDLTADELDTLLATGVTIVGTGFGGGDTVIHFTPDDTVTIVGFTALQADDFKLLT